MNKKIFISTGEVSGDLHGSRVMESIKKLDKNAKFRFWGGEKMREIGGKSPNLTTSDVAILAAMYIFDEYSSSTVGESSFKGRIESNKRK